MIAWMTALVAVALAVAALELLVVRRALADDGVFAWPVLRRDYAPWLRAIAGVLFSYRGTLAILVVQLAAALALLATATSDSLLGAISAWTAAAASLAISVRFRGSYNGGSDSMLLAVLIGLAVARTATDVSIVRGALAYVAVQLVLSYVLAGIAKLRDPAWRAGRALALLVELPQYRVPRRLVAIAKRPSIGRLGTWAILAFELAFPIAFLHPTACIAMLAIGAAFHVANAAVFGLNRFLWTWIAAYPALIYCANLRA